MTTDTGDDAPPQAPFTPKHLMLILLPAIIFLVTYALAWRILESLYVPVETEWPANHREYINHRLGTLLRAACIGGALEILACLAVTIRLTPPTSGFTRIGSGERVPVFFLLLVLNLCISFGGCIAVPPFLRGERHSEPVDPERPHSSVR